MDWSQAAVVIPQHAARRHWPHCRTLLSIRSHLCWVPSVTFQLARHLSTLLSGPWSWHSAHCWGPPPTVHSPSSTYTRKHGPPWCTADKNWGPPVQFAVSPPHYHLELRDVLRQLLRSSDYFGSQRALGATFFTLCQFSPHNYQWFNDLGGAGNALLEVMLIDCQRHHHHRRSCLLSWSAIVKNV